MLIAKGLPKSAALESLALALYKSAATGHAIEDIAKTMGGGDEVLALYQRAAATLGTTGTSGFASQLVQTAFGAFISSLPTSAAARIIALGMTIPMGRAEGFLAPTRNGAATALPWVEEGNPIPVRSFTFQGLTLRPKKLSAMSVISRELAKRAGGEAAVRQLLREDAELAVDSAYLSTTAASDAAHAGLLNGLTPSAGYAGGDVYAFEHDVLAILAHIGPQNSGSIVYVVAPAAAERIAVRFPLFKGTVLPSQAVADGTLIGIDAGSLVHSFGGFDTDLSTEGLVHMSDAALPIVEPGTPATVADPVRSLFQTDCISIRVIGDIAFGARKANAVAYVTGATW